MLMESNFIRRDESMMHTIADGYELNRIFSAKWQPKHQSSAHVVLRKPNTYVTRLLYPCVSASRPKMCCGTEKLSRTHWCHSWLHASVLVLQMPCPPPYPLKNRIKVGGGDLKNSAPSKITRLRFSKSLKLHHTISGAVLRSQSKFQLQQINSIHLKDIKISNISLDSLLYWFRS